MYRIRPTPVVPRAPLRPTIPRPRFHQSRFYLHIALGRGAARFFLPSGVLIGVLHRWVVSPAFYRNIGLISAGAGGIYLCNLEQVPVTGRWRFNIVPSSIEQALGAAAVEQIHSECADYFLPEADSRVQRVKKVLARLLPYAEGEWVKDLNWEVTVIECPDDMAFVCPGGKIFFSTGSLALYRDENEIAVVLGHEIAHVVARHSVESLSQGPLVLLGVLALSLFDTSLHFRKYLVDRFLCMPASRKQEAEADYIGFMIMAQGCYKPHAAIDFWARMKIEAQGPPQILSTHPSHCNREKKLREWLPKAIEKAEASECFGTHRLANQFSSALNSFKG